MDTILVNTVVLAILMNGVKNVRGVLVRENAGHYLLFLLSTTIVMLTSAICVFLVKQSSPNAHTPLFIDAYGSIIGNLPLVLAALFCDNRGYVRIPIISAKTAVVLVTALGSFGYFVFQGSDNDLYIWKIFDSATSATAIMMVTVWVALRFYSVNATHLAAVTLAAGLSWAAYNMYYWIDVNSLVGRFGYVGFSVLATYLPRHIIPYRQA